MSFNTFKIGDVIEQVDSDNLKVIEIREPVKYAGGETVTVVIYEPVENEL